MKKLLLFLIVALSFSCITGCGKLNSAKKNEDSNTSSVNQIKKEDRSMVFVNLSSSRKCKKINDQETIKTVLNFIDNSEKTPIVENEPRAGWVMLINLTTSDGLKQYSVIGNNLTIGDSCYKVSADFLNSLKTLYSQINVQEEDYIIK